MSAVAAGITAAGTALSAGLQAGASSAMNKKTIRANDRWREQSRAWQLEDEARVNAYNSPQNQMALMKAAGISPALAAQSIAGQSLSQGPSTYTGPDSPPTPDPGAAPDFSGVAGSAMQALSLRESMRNNEVQRSVGQAQADASTAAADASRADAALKAAQEASERVQRDLRALSLKAGRDDYERDRRQSIYKTADMAMALRTRTLQNMLTEANTRAVEYNREFQQGTLRNAQEANRISRDRLDLESPYFGREKDPYWKLDRGNDGHPGPSSRGQSFLWSLRDMLSLGLNASLGRFKK